MRVQCLCLSPTPATGPTPSPPRRLDSEPPRLVAGLLLALTLGAVGVVPSGPVAVRAQATPAVASPACTDASASDANKATVRRVYGIFAAGDVADVDAVIDPSWTNHAPAFAALPRGPDGFVALGGFFRTAFPDLRITVDDGVAEGDRVAARYTVRGTHTGPLGEIPATGRAVEVQAIDLFRIVDGRVTDVWPAVDQLALLTQIGVVPGAAEATPPPEP